MKKRKCLILLITCVVCLLFMFGCKKEKGNNEVDTTSVETEKAITGSSGIEVEDNAYTSNDVNYTIKTKSIVTTNINVSYPQIVGYNNTEIQKKWNDIIKSKVESDMNYIGSRDTYYLSYTVKTQNEEMISILMFGESSNLSNDNKARIFKYTFNIDLETGAGIRLKDKVDTEKLASNMLAGKKYSLVAADNNKFREYINLFYDKKELLDSLNEYDFSESFSYAKGYTYFENGKIYLCMNVNQNLGNCIEILIDN